MSGPVVMDASRHWIVAHASGQATEMRCNFLPGCDFTQVERWLIESSTLRLRVSLRKVLTERLPERFVVAIIRYAGVDPATPLSQVARAQRRALVHVLTAFNGPGRPGILLAALWAESIVNSFSVVFI